MNTCLSGQFHNETSQILNDLINNLQSVKRQLATVFCTMLGCQQAALQPRQPPEDRIVTGRPIYADEILVCLCETALRYYASNTKTCTLKTFSTKSNCSCVQ